MKVIPERLNEGDNYSERGLHHHMDWGPKACKKKMSQASAVTFPCVLTVDAI